MESAEQGLPVRCDVVFRGRVQGVGFRYNAVGVARHYPITGYVMNCADGSVAMTAEGTKETVSLVIQTILESMQGNVTGHTITWGNPTGGFRDFSIRREDR